MNQANTRRPAVLGGQPAFPHDLFVTRPAMPSREAFADKVAPLFESAWLTNAGPLVIELEDRLSGRLGVRGCKAFSNGTTALLTALRALDLQGRVLTTAFTFPATPHCIEWNGLEPVFCDIDPDTYCLDPEAVAAEIDANTSAILPVHVFGNPCAVDRFEALGKEHGLRVVYDAAHCFGVEHQGRGIGGFGDCAVLSFHATKVFHSAEGGAALAEDPALCERFALLRNFGIVSEDEVRGVGLNGKLSELHAAMGLLVLEQIDEEIENRRQLAQLYREGLSQIPGIKLQAFADDTVRNYFNQTIEIDAESFGLTRDQVHRALRSDRIVTRKYFFPLCSENDRYRDLPSAAAERLPNSHRLASRILSVPLFGSLGRDDVHLIVDTLAALHAEAPAVQRELGEAGR